MPDLFSAITCPVCAKPCTDFGCGETCRAPRRVTFPIPPGTEEQRCRSCGASVFFVQHAKTQKWMPLNANGTSHFSDCPDAASFRRAR